MIDPAKAESGQNTYCKQHNIAILAYSPLALGMLTGKVGPERVFPEGDLRRNSKRFTVDNRRKVKALLDAFEPIRAAHGCTIGQLVIAWTIHQPGLTHALVGARTREQAIENAEAGRISLSPTDLAAMNASVQSALPAIV